MNVVDSSAWIEYFEGGSNAAFFADAIEEVDTLLVPTISLLEVYKHVLRHAGREDAVRAVAAMQQGQEVPLDRELALSAAEVGAAHRLPLADSVIYASALRHGASVWTQDGDFRDLPGVQFREKR